MPIDLKELLNLVSRSSDFPLSVYALFMNPGNIKMKCKRDNDPQAELRMFYSWWSLKISGEFDFLFKNKEAMRQPYSLTSLVQGRK